MNASDPKLDAILKALAVELLEEDVEQALSVDTSNTVVSEKALRRVRRKIQNYDKDSWWSSVPLACRRVVAALMIVCTVSFCLCMSIEAVRGEIVSMFFEWYDKFVAVFYVAEETPPSIIEEYREPMLQLAGTEMEIEAQDDLCYSIVYIRDDIIEMVYDQMVITDDSHDHDNERCIISDTKVAGYDAKLFEYEDGRIHLTWHDNKYVYTISSYSQNVDVELIYRIAESVR